MPVAPIEDLSFITLKVLCDAKPVSFDHADLGRAVQQFDHSNDPGEREPSTATVSPSGHSVVVGSFNKYLALSASSVYPLQASNLQL